MNIEKISVKGHYVWVDKDAEIKEGDAYLSPSGIWFYNHLNPNHVNDYNKIIAASHELRLEGVPTYVERLAEQHVKDWEYERLLGSGSAGLAYDSFMIGYQSSEKEKSDELLTKYQEGMSKGLELCKKLYTEDDVRKAIELAQKEEWDEGGYLGLCYEPEKIIEQLKSQKTK